MYLKVEKKIRYLANNFVIVKLDYSCRQLAEYFHFKIKFS